MVEDIAKLVRIKSDKQEAKEGKPFGEGPAEVLAVALEIASKMGFKTHNYDNYAGAIDLNDHERKLDILAHLDVVPAGNAGRSPNPSNRSSETAEFGRARPTIKVRPWRLCTR